MAPDEWLLGLLVQWACEATTAVILWAIGVTALVFLAVGVLLGRRSARHPLDRITVLAEVELAAAKTVAIPRGDGRG